MFWKNVIDKIWYFNIFLIIILGTLFYLVLAKNSKINVINRIYEKSRIVARAESSNIVSFFEFFGTSVAARARYIDTNSNKGLQEFMDQWSDTSLIGGIALTDENGIVILNANSIKTKDVGMSLVDRDYFDWAKTKAKVGDYFIGKPVIGRGKSTAGKMIVPVASAVFDGEKFKGAIVSSVFLEAVAKSHLEFMEVSDLTKISLNDGSGNVLYEENLEFGEQNLIEVNYPFQIGNQKWFVKVISPEIEVINQIKPIHIRQLSVFSLIVLAIIMYGAIIERVKKEEPILPV